MIGNDVVDLGDPEVQAEGLNPRFDTRVFTPGERSQIERGRSAHEMRWMLWACKEAAYKLAKRENGETVFSPVAFEVLIEEPSRAIVSVHGQEICAGLSRFDDAVHVIAVRRPADLDRVVFEVAAHPADQSRAVRDLARHRVATLYSVPPDGVEITKGHRRMPIIRLSGEPCGTLSLSHHGRYVAFAFLETEASLS